jgi:hypothetical protein
MEITIGCIVEGHGEVEAVPVLIRRLVSEADPSISVRIPPPIRIPKSRLVKEGELEKAVELIARKVAPTGAVLVLLDSDEDCPAILGPDLLSRARNARSDLPLAVVLAKQEYEAWFLAAASSLRGQRGLRADLAAPAEPEGIRGAKEWLSARMAGNLSYVETLDQPALTKTFDMEQARQSDSFDKCRREVEKLMQVLRAAHEGVGPL